MSPRFSVLTAVFDPDRSDLEQCLASVRSQTWGDWEHVLVDDASTQPWVAETLAAAAVADPRVRHVRRPVNGGIVAASRDALAAAQGDYVALLDHDDLLTTDALAEMAAALDASPGGADVLYSDHDLIGSDGGYVWPYLKPDFSPERLRSQNYITHFLVARRTLVDAVGGFREGYDGAQDHDLVLRLTERSAQVVHVPKVLYHWRQSAGSVATDADNKRWAFEAGVRAVTDHCARIGIAAAAELTRFDGVYRVRRRVTERPLVSVIVPTRGGSGRVWGLTRAFVVDAVRTLAEHSTYAELEFVVVYDPPTPPAVLQALERIAGDRLVLVPYEGPFNFSDKINQGVAASAGELLLLLNDDTELLAPDSVEVMVGHLQTPGVAMVGAKLLFADGTLQHGGHVYTDGPRHACIGWGSDSPGPAPLQPLAVERECSGVTAAAALVRRDAYDAVGGLDADFPVNFNDVDFSLKLRAAGHRIIWTPYASWYHFESRTRVAKVDQHEVDALQARWGAELDHDPYYNPNLVPGRTDWLELPRPAPAAVG